MSSIHPILDRDGFEPCNASHLSLSKNVLVKSTLLPSRLLHEKFSQRRQSLKRFTPTRINIARLRPKPVLNISFHFATIIDERNVKTTWYSDELISDIADVLHRHGVRTDIRDVIFKMLLDGSRLKVSAPVPAKVHDLSREWRILNEDDEKAIQQAALEHKWIERGKDRRTALHWIVDIYALWIPGLTQAQLKRADLPLWTQLQAIIQNERQGRASIPSWFKVPAGEATRLLVPNTKDAQLLLLDADAIAATNARRAYEKASKARERERNRNG
jgi:hypothetical protein